MPHNRYFIDDPLTLNNTVTLAGNEFHHLAHVMRQRVGDTVELVNGRSTLATALITHLLKDKAQLNILHTTTGNQNKQSLILAQALPTLSHLSFILEKGTELGATAFWLFPGILSEKDNVKPAQLPKLEGWIISAMKQCGRLDLPTITLKPPLKQWSKPPGHLYFGDTRPDAPRPQPTGGDHLVFIGPEKGFHSDEIAILQSWGSQGVRLHTNILRVETAALVALTLFS